MRDAFLLCDIRKNLGTFNSCLVLLQRVWHCDRGVDTYIQLDAGTTIVLGLLAPSRNNFCCEENFWDRVDNLAEPVAVLGFHAASSRSQIPTRELSTPFTGGVHPSPLKNFLTHSQHRPPLEMLRIPTRTLIRSMLFWAVGGYCRNLNYNSTCSLY